jgi:type IV pilus assembly protein PilV
MLKGKNKPGFILKSIGSRGLTLLEVLAAIAILAFGLLAIATMQATSVKGNSQAIGITEAVSLAQDRVEYLMRLPYDHADLTDKTPFNGTGQDALPVTPDLAGDGVDDDGGNFGLDDTVDGGGNPIADVYQPMVDGRYNIYWNIAVDEPINNVKTVRIIVVWTDRGTEKRAVVDFMKSNII